VNAIFESRFQKFRLTLHKSRQQQHGILDIHDRVGA